MTERSDKDELKLEAAKTIIAASLQRNDILFTTLLSLAAIFIPAYPAILALNFLQFSDRIKPLLMLPELFWGLSVFVCVFHLFPRLRTFNLGNINQILQQNVDVFYAARLRALLASACFFLGVAFSAYIVGTAMPALTPTPAATK